MTDGSSVGTVRRARWWLELLFGLGLFGVYLIIKFLPLPANFARALANGEAILALERLLGLDFELPANRWLAEQGWLMVVANYEYAFTYIVTTLVLLVWVFARRPEHYSWVRNSFLLLNLVALAVFWLYPVAPPRMLPDAGFVDTVRVGQTWGSWGSPMVDNANQLAAMPSLHIAWALWVSVVLARISGGLLVQVVSAVHVLVTFVVIVATGNHYWLDAVGGVLVVWVGIALTSGGRRRCDRLTPDEARLLAASARPTGALVLLDTSGGRVPSPEQARSVLAARLPVWPRLRQRPPRRARPPHWAEHAHLNWAWHVRSFDVSRPDGTPGGMPALHRLVAALAAEPLPRDRPLWRLAVVTGIGDDVAAVVLLAHPVLAGESVVALATDVLGGPSLWAGGASEPAHWTGVPGGFATVRLDQREVPTEGLPGGLADALAGESVPVTVSSGGEAASLVLGLPVAAVVAIPALPADAPAAVAVLEYGDEVSIGVLAAGDVGRFARAVDAALDQLRLDSRRG
ncbi:phosphatase PAP2 family protein [Prauserella sp. ASG 168]|uniref:Phosphatase PAP2 family protein n=1 Tax=Prauserella cavernicola TaxID=2800127 RepID=A0A934V8E1_9PSEU|nr:phosphatase PAP2 family protein [Prauserella cavernicola]